MATLRLHHQLIAVIQKAYSSYDNWPAPIRVVIALIVDFAVVNLAVFFWHTTGTHIESATLRFPSVHDHLTKLEGFGITVLYSIFLIELIRNVLKALFGEAVTKAYNFLKEIIRGWRPVLVA